MISSVCIVSLSPVRSAASGNAPQMSQILYGESAVIFHFENGFAKIGWQQNETGWVDERHLKIISEAAFTGKKHTITKTCGCYEVPEGKLLLSAGSEIQFSDDAGLKSPCGNDVVHTAVEFLNVPFISGGRSFFGVDAPGFIQLLYKIHGRLLPRDLTEMSQTGESLFFVGESCAGDIAFFSDEEGNMIHAGIMLNSFEIIHADEKVRIDTIDSTGIYSKSQKKHTYFLRVVQRIF